MIIRNGIKVWELPIFGKISLGFSFCLPPTDYYDLHQKLNTKLNCFQRRPLSSHELYSSLIVNLVIVKMDCLKLFPVLLWKPTDTLIRQWVTTHIEIFKLRELLFWYLKSTFVTYVAVTQVKFSKIFPIMVHQIFNTLAIKEVAAWIKVGVLKWILTRRGQSWSAM